MGFEKGVSRFTDEIKNKTEGERKLHLNDRIEIGMNSDNTIKEESVELIISPEI